MKNADAAADDAALSLLRVLFDDVSRALLRLDEDKSPAHRRETIRTMFAAIEGAAWVYREHIRSIAASVGVLTPTLDMAFNEKTYSVAENGMLIEQTKFVPFLAMIRLTSRLLEEVNADAKLDFSQKGWENLKAAIAVRHRLTHPKCVDDLGVSPKEINNAIDSFFWLLDLVMRDMEAANAELVAFNKWAKWLVQKLIEGDETALAAYREAEEIVAQERWLLG